MDKPTKPLPKSPEEAQKIISKFEKCSRDHLLTYCDDVICINLAKNWKEIDAGLQQVLRDMAKPVPTAEAQVNMNAILVAGSKIISRLHELAERGADLISTTEK